MKVYVVMINDGEGGFSPAVYSSRERAEAWLRGGRASLPWLPTSRPHFLEMVDEEGNEWTIVEHVVDEDP